jgi:GT2 family glycosyltransferase
MSDEPLNPEAEGPLPEASAPDGEPAAETPAPDNIAAEKPAARTPVKHPQKRARRKKQARSNPDKGAPPADSSAENVENAKNVENAERGANRIVDDATYGTLREDNRVVMRHTIALNIDNFRAASESFVGPRQARTFPELANSTPPFFSIVIANHNGEGHLPIVLNALRAQTFGDFETIVVDDASHDDSVLLVESDFPQVRLIVNRTNVGFAVTCNIGADAANGRYIVMLNSDTEPDPQWLEALALACVQNPQAAAVASKMLLFDRRTVLHTTGDLMGRNGLARNRGAWARDNGQFDAQRAIFSACGGASAYRRDIWQALGGFDEHFWMYLEDVDYGFRAQLAGFGSVYAPDARVYHHLSATGGDVMASYYVGRNALWVIAKNMPAGLLRANWRQIVGGQLRIATDALRAIQGKAARARLRGQLAGLLGLGMALAQRKRIQRARAIPEAELARLLQ